MPLSTQQLRRLKKKFDTLSYADKLAFWDEHEDFSFHYTTCFIDDVPDAEMRDPANYISLFPLNAHETKQFNTWLLNHHLLEPRNNIAELKKQYFKVVENNPLPIEFTEHEIAAIETRLQNQTKLHISLRYYLYGYQSVVINQPKQLEFEAGDFARMVQSYAQGIAHAHYKGFLQKALQQLKKGEEVMPVTAASNKAKVKPALKLDDIFTESGWKKYVTALQKTTPPILNKKNEFIGQPKMHKGVICSWFKHLQQQHLIKPVNRRQLAAVLNAEIASLNLGADGKTFDGYSRIYEQEFKQQLVAIAKTGLP